MVGRKTDSKKLKLAITKISAWCKANRHNPMREQWETLKAKIIGHYTYYGISLNGRSISEFYDRVRKIWLKWLKRRGWKMSRNWETYAAHLEKWPLPKPRIMHKYC